MAQSNAKISCPGPTISARPACGGVVTLSVVSLRCVPPGGTYTWDLGNGATASGTGPLNVIYPSAGTFTVTLTINNLPAFQATATTTVAPDVSFGCCPAGLTADYLLGGVGRTTTLSGGGSYGGSYRVLGNLVLTNGTYTLSGATFYVDGQASKTANLGGGYQRTVKGYTITVGTNATLLVDNSTLTASGSETSCPMWGGLVLDSGPQGQGPAGSYRLQVLNNSIISHAWCGMTLADNTTSGTGAYRLKQSTFANNYTGVRDVGTHLSGQVSVIDGCAFNSDAPQMHFPYDQTVFAGPGADPFYTYQALLVTPQLAGGGTSGVSHMLEVTNNTFNQAVYGIVNNQPRRGGVAIRDNFLNKIFLTGIWTVNNDDNGTLVAEVSGNFAGMSAAERNTEQIDPAAPFYGILGEQPAAYNRYVNNEVGGIPGINPPNVQIGLCLDYQTDAVGNRLGNLTQGIRSENQNGGSIFDNRTVDCQDAFVAQSDPNSSYFISRLGCNTFSATSGTPNLRGIVVPQNAQGTAAINNIGSPTDPAGNRFSGLSEQIHNDAAPFNYYRTASAQELLTNIIGPATVITVSPSVVDPDRYCQGRNAQYGNGVNAARGTAPATDYLAALMDSVRRRLVPSGRYQD